MAKPPASPALIEMLEKTGELDQLLSSAGLRFERPVELGPTPRPSREFRIEPPDWDEEARERQAAERERQRQEREEILAEELARIEQDVEPPTEVYPAKKQRAKRTPNIDRALKWRRHDQEAKP
jgi:hypothetical protein